LLSPLDLCNTPTTCTQSAPLKNIVIFTLSAPIRTSLNIHFSGCRNNPQGQNVLRTAPRDERHHVGETQTGRPGLRLCWLPPLHAHACPHAASAPAASTRCCCSSCLVDGGTLQKLAIPVWTRPTGALNGFLPLMTRQKLKKSNETQSAVIRTPSSFYLFW